MTRTLVIIVSYNISKWIDLCLSSVRESDADCIVIDNASTDGSAKRIRDDYPFATLIESKENIGFGAANNIGIKYAIDNGYDYIYLLNGDAWLLPETLDTLCKAFNSDEGKEYGILSPVQLTGSGDRMDPRFLKHCGKAVKEADGRQIVPVRFVMASHWMIRRSCFEKVGGFSPAFTHNGEDDNYIDRALYHKFKVGVVPETKAIHDRENRPMSRQVAMRLKCIGSLVKISDPRTPLIYSLIREPLKLFAMSIYRRSLQILRFIPSFIRRYPELIRLRKESVIPGAFL